MALTVGELVGYLRIDDTDFNRKIDTGERRFQGLGRVVGAGAKTIATALVGATTLTAALGVSAFQVGKDFNVLQQNSRSALTTLLGSAEAAADQMDRLDDFASNSPFARQVWITAQQQLIGFGTEAERVVPILDAVQNAVASVGGSNEQVEQITYALAQMQGQGKLTGETLNQLGQYGIDAASVLGDAWGKTGAEVREMASKPGGIPVDQVWDPLVDGLLDRFGGATEGLRKQWDGATDRVKAAWRDIGSILAAPFIDPMGGGRAVDWANGFADALRAVQRQAGPAVDLIVRRLGPGLERVNPSLALATRTIDQLDLSRLNTQLDQLVRYAPLIAGTSGALFALGTRNLPVLSALGLSGINPVVAGIAALVAASPELRAAGGDFLRALSPLVPVARDVAFVAADTAMVMLREMSPALRDVLLAAAPLIVSLGQGLAPVLVTLMQAAVPVVEVVSDVVSAVAGLPEPVLAAVAAFALLQAARGPVGSALTVIGTGVRILNERMALQEALARMSGVEIGRMGAASAVAQVQVRNLGTAMKTAFISNPIGLAIAGVAAAFGLWYKEVSESKSRVDELYNSLDDLTGAVTENTREVVANQLAQVDAIEDARTLGLAHGVLTDAILGNADAQAKVEDAIRTAQQAADDASRGLIPYTDNTIAQGDAAARLERAYGTLTPEMEQAREKFDQVSGEVGRTTRELDGNAEATRTAEDAIRDLRTALDELNDNSIDAEKAQIRFRDAVDRATEAARESTEGLSLNTAEGRLNRDALLAIAETARDNALAIAENTGSQRRFQDAMKEGRDELIRVGQQFGLTEDQAKAFADRVLEIPDEAVVKAVFDDIAARRRIDTFKQYAHIPPVVIDAQLRESNPYYRNRATGGIEDPVRRFAAGGGVDAQGRHVPRVPQIVKGGANILWGEPETHWEAYISGMPSARMRNVGVLAEAAERLGYMVLPKGTIGHADGAMRDPAPAAPTRPWRGEAPLVHVEQVVQGTPQDIGDEVEWALIKAGG